jgi:hypothetical protein
MPRSTLVTLTAVCLAASAVPARAQQPRVTNGLVIPQAVASNLDAAFRSAVNAHADASWIGYAVPSARPTDYSCCYDGGGWGRCGLEPASASARADAAARQAAAAGPVHLEASPSIAVLYRVENRTVGKIRFFSLDCELDAGGLSIVWLDGVKPADSIALLSTFISGEGQRDTRVANSALGALAAHGDPAAVPALIRFARQDPNTRVRGEALFWLAQKAGDKAVGEITAAIEQDPDTDVKRRAVFALSQLPKDEGVPLLIQVAKSNKNPAVRKQAMFWLGQSRDPRALAFFEDVLR